MVDYRVHEVEVSHDHHGLGWFGLGVQWSGVECGGEIAGTNVGLSVSVWR